MIPASLLDAIRLDAEEFVVDRWMSTGGETRAEALESVIYWEGRGGFTSQWISESFGIKLRNERLLTALTHVWFEFVRRAIPEPTVDTATILDIARTTKATT